MRNFPVSRSSRGTLTLFEPDFSAPRLSGRPWLREPRHCILQEGLGIRPRSPRTSAWLWLKEPVAQIHFIGALGGRQPGEMGVVKHRGRWWGGFPSTAQGSDSVRQVTAGGGRITTVRLGGHQRSHGEFFLPSCYEHCLGTNQGGFQAGRGPLDGRVSALSFFCSPDRM